MARKVTPTTILSEPEVQVVIEGVGVVFRDWFKPPVVGPQFGSDLEDIVRFSSLGRRCAERRAELGRTVKDVALELKVPQYRLKAIENGHVKDVVPDVLGAYVAFLGLGAWYERWAKANPRVAARRGKVRGRRS